jgi:D-alanyl-D-alanine carboxypeptidase
MGSTVTGSTATSSNIYSQLYSTSAANDYFGSQIFGQNGSVFQSNQTTFTQAPNDLASSLIQQHAAANSTGYSGVTAQDYIKAQQIANMFSNSTSSYISPYTSYSNNDYFAQQLFSNNFC